MPDTVFLSAVEKVTAGAMSLVELIRAASELAAAGDAVGAEQLYRVWIRFNPDSPQLFAAYYNLSTLPMPQARAVEALRAATELNPEFWPARINLGSALERTGDIPGALKAWAEVVERLPTVTGSAVTYKVMAHKQIARVLLDRQQGPTAESYLQQAIEIEPKQRDAMEQYVGLRLSHCRWPVVAPSEAVDREAILSGFSPLSMACYTDDPLLQLAATARYVELTVKDEGPSPADRRDAPIDLENRRLRVGYVSSDLRDHAIGYLMAELVELHDKTKVETFVYYCGPPASGALNERYRAAVDHWTDITDLTDEAAARAIAADGVDILVDVNGHTRFTRTGVFAKRPAPVIVNWLGFPGTMGTPFHHYIIADDWIIPPESEMYYAEKVVRLPCYQANDRKRVVAPERPTRAAAGLPDEGFVFCCFNGTQKFTRHTFERWVEILRRTPGSVLWLLGGDPGTETRLVEFAEQRGVARGRLIFAPKLANPYHLARYPLADLFLDTAPYGAHTTASDALWMGVPVLTHSGRSFASRVCGSLVRSAGLADLVCESAGEYVERAVALANDPEALRAYRARLEQGRATSTLFDMDRLVAALEDLYLGMCEDHRQGRLPRPDLDNLEAYFQVGIEHDPDAVETQTIEDYHGLYLARLARRHRFRPIRADRRLWTEAEVAKAEGRPPAEDATSAPVRMKRRA